MSHYSVTLSTLSEHPASPVLLTRSGPLATWILAVGSIKKPTFLAHLKFENRSRSDYLPNASNHSLYLTKLRICRSYPEGNFGGNQLLDSSMSLSPLYPNSTNDLHVSTATDLQQSFLRLRPIQEKITIFRVPTLLLNLIRFSN